MTNKNGNDQDGEGDTGGRRRRASRSSGVFVRLDPDDRARVEYWSAKRGYPSISEYVSDAVAEKIRRENLDFENSRNDLLVNRINQLIDAQKAEAVRNENLYHVITVGFDALIGLTRGDNYLTDEPDGELGTPADGAGELVELNRMSASGGTTSVPSSESRELAS